MCWDCNKRFNFTSGQWQDMKNHNKVMLQSNFESKSKQDSCFGIVTRDSFDIWTLNGRTWSITTMSYWKVILNQRANRIRVLALWHLDLKVQDMNQHHKVILKSNFESKSEQDLCVGIVTRGSIWHLDLKVQNLKYHHNVILQSSFESYFTKKRRNQLTCSGISRSLCLFSEKECVNDRE